MNFQVVSGNDTETTDGVINGTGNIIIGYNEGTSEERTGSHNLVIGTDHSFSSYGGIVAGTDNEIAAPSASLQKMPTTKL